jgi:hypothetical protein
MVLNSQSQSIVDSMGVKRGQKHNLAFVVVENQPHASPCQMRKHRAVLNVRRRGW